VLDFRVRAARAQKSLSPFRSAPNGLLRPPLAPARRMTQVGRNAAPRPEVTRALGGFRPGRWQVRELAAIGINEPFPRRDDMDEVPGSLANKDRELVEPHLEPVTLNFRVRLEAADRRTEKVCFIAAGLASVVAVGGGARRGAEVAVVGREGMVGFAAVLGAERCANETFVQVAGHGRSIGTSVLQGLMQMSRSLPACVQAGQTALANVHGKIEERLARWLLMAHDRFEGDDLHLTHELLSTMLGVRRAGITTALHELAHRAVE
jgi:CRP-like cAMP-binding protein